MEEIVGYSTVVVVTNLINGLVDLLSLKTKAVWDAWQDGIEPIELWDKG